MCITRFFFFFQAEDGIRDLIVTGVQTCALPISHLLLLRRWELLGGLEVEVADDAARPVGARVPERDVDEVLNLVRRRAPAVGPEPDHALGALDVVEQIAQALHEAPTPEVRVLPVDDLVADVERAELLEHPRLALLRLRLESLPRRLLALPRSPPARRLQPELTSVDDELVALAEQPVNRRERRGDLAGEIGLLLLRELFLVDVHDFLVPDVVPAELLLQLTESLEREGGASGGPGVPVLAPFVP